MKIVLGSSFLVPDVLAGLVQADVASLELASKQTPKVDEEEAHTGSDGLLAGGASGFAFRAKDGGELDEPAPLWLELSQPPY